MDRKNLPAVKSLPDEINQSTHDSLPVRRFGSFKKNGGILASAAEKHG
jgi:hypothetical protein